eukprot:RCo041339
MASPSPALGASLPSSSADARSPYPPPPVIFEPSKDGVGGYVPRTNFADFPESEMSPEEHELLHAWRTAVIPRPFFMGIGSLICLAFFRMGRQRWAFTLLPLGLGPDFQISWSNSQPQRQRLQEFYLAKKIYYLRSGKTMLRSTVYVENDTGVVGRG